MRIAFIMVFLTSCSTFQVLNAVDTAQTYQVVESPCHHESNGFTRKVISENPSKTQVFLYMAATAYLHKLVLDRLSGWKRQVFLFISVSSKAQNVIQNQNRGIYMDSYVCG